MIISIALSDKHKIGLDNHDRFLVDDTKVSIKEVPFVRYKFKQYGDAEIAYIKQMKNIFKHSAHMVEIELSGDTSYVLHKIEENIDNIIRFIYVPINDSHVTDGLDEQTEELLEAIEDCDYDRIMIKDESQTLYSLAASRLKKQIADATDFSVKEIGICNSPLSFHGDACLTAVKARELSAEYAENDEVALPSANHENMNTCGCIRYHLFTSDVQAPISKKTATKTTENKAKPRETSPKGIMDIRF